VLSFVELPEEWIALVSRNDEVSVHHIPAAKSFLAATVTRFRRECSDPNTDPDLIRRDARQLYEWLIEPFVGHLPASGPLIVELDGALRGAPVQAFQSAGGDYLGDQFSVLVSAGYGSGRENNIDTGSFVLLVSSPVLAGDAAARFPPLPDTAREAEAVRMNLKSVRALDGRDATVAALTAALPQARIFHSAGHGYADSGNGALIFAPQDPGKADYELLRSSDLSRQDWSRCRLAVLSACAAAAGEIEGPHNPDILVRALTHAGVPRVAASLWNVDSAATSELISAFYTNLSKGTSAAEALRAARQRVRRHPEWSHPLLGGIRTCTPFIKAVKDLARQTYGPRP
jgi:CHAT domain-containing protein